MKLKELVDVVSGELEAAGLEPAAASLSLVFSAKTDRDGRIACEFIDASSVSKPRAEELHRLEVALSGDREKIIPDRAEKERSARPVLEPDDSVPDVEDIDAPAIFRIRLAQEEAREPALLSESGA